MFTERPLRIGITCYPSVGGSGILATALGHELAQRGHEAHFISYEPPFRLSKAPGVFFHPVTINDYELFKYPDYTLPLSVKMAEVSDRQRLDILHVHYAVPHATAAILARDMMPLERRPSVVTTLHGTDTTLLGMDAGYAPAIRHALVQSDAVTTVSAFLAEETRRVLPVKRSIDVIHNFFEPRVPRRSREAVRAELGVHAAETLLVHASNLRPLKRVDLLLDAVSRVQPRESFRLVILAGGDFAPYTEQARRLGIEDRLVVREQVFDIEAYLLAADAAVFTSDSESFCLGILEAMCFARPAVSTAVGGVPEVVEDGVSGLLVPAGDADGIARSIETLIHDPERRRKLGLAAQIRARERFSAAVIVPRYEALYRRLAHPQAWSP